MKKSSIFLVIGTLLLTACGGINYIGIETCNPGEVTFPNDVKKIMMVNNALPQSDDSGYAYTVLGIAQDTARAKMDSALFDICTACGRAILDADYFEDVLLFQDPLRGKGIGLVDKKLNREQVAALCTSNDADAIIALDKMLFYMEKKVENIGAGFLSGTIDIKMNGILRAYLPERNQPLATILVEDSVRFEQMADNNRLLDLYLPTPDVEDSVRFEQMADNNRLLDLYLPTPEDALRIAGDYLGNKLSAYFVPHWSEETRWFYSNMNSRWKEATAYASEGKWDEAERIWKMLYQTIASESKRAKLASNIALTEEMQSQFQNAYDWAGKAENLFRKSEGDASNNTKLLKAYQEVLGQRIQSEQKLNIQIGHKD